MKRVSGKEYPASFMNDTKWDKLLGALTGTLEVVYVNYKLVHSNDIYNTLFYTPDFKPFFEEPVLYREVEWIEFPAEILVTVNKRASRKIIKTVRQDINLIKNTIEKTGNFVSEYDSEKIKIYAYV